MAKKTEQAKPEAPKTKVVTVTEKRLVAPHKLEQRKGQGWKATTEYVGQSVIMTREVQRTVPV